MFFPTGSLLMKFERAIYNFSTCTIITCTKGSHVINKQKGSKEIFYDVDIEWRPQSLSWVFQTLDFFFLSTTCFKALLDPLHTLSLLPYPEWLLYLLQRACAFPTSCPQSLLVDPFDLLDLVYPKPSWSAVFTESPLFLIRVLLFRVSIPQLPCNYFPSLWAMFPKN